MTTQNTEPGIEDKKIRGSGFVVACGVLLLILIGFYAFKPDFAAAVTIFPFWTWLPLGLFPLLRWKKLGKRAAIGLLLAWLVATFNLCEEWLGFVRIPTTGEPSREIVVVSLNCAGGSIEAAREVARQHPDIVLLQESPGETELKALQMELFGSEGGMVRGPDGAILSRFPLRPFSKPRVDATAAVATLAEGKEINVISLRLMPPAFRPDLIFPSAWTEVTENRKSRRIQLQEVAAFVGTMPKRPTIMGGDFNAQSGDAVFRQMPTSLRDPFYEGGFGWCHTAVNEYPLARIDQIWISKEFWLPYEWVQKTANSDHRMVVLSMLLE